MYEARPAAIVMELRDGVYRVSDHARRQMRRPDRQLTVAMVVAALTAGDVEVIEDYPADERGASCLVLCQLAGRALHVQMSYPPRPAIVTVYWSDAQRHR
jgi:hypothetical protein